MNDNVVEFTGTTVLDIPPDNVLNGAIGQLSEVLVIGFDHEGQLYMAASKSELAGHLLLAKLAEREILEQVTEG